MSTPNPNGNGNGSYSTKEYLARIEAKLDAVQAHLQTVQLNFAVHEAQPHHENARREMEELRSAVESSRVKLATYAGAIAVAIFALELIARAFF